VCVCVCVWKGGFAGDLEEDELQKLSREPGKSKARRMWRSKLGVSFLLEGFPWGADTILLC
jgi:hypothetical protein